MDAVRTPVAIVGLGALLPDAPDVDAFWRNVTEGRYSITDVPPDRWDPELYYDPDPRAPDKTYSRIGGWVREYEWDPLGWGLRMPPKVSDALDNTQRWAIACSRAAFADYGHPQRPLPTERTAVILGNAMGGERHYETALRLAFPEFARELSASPTFAALPPDVRAAVVDETRKRFGQKLPVVDGDAMPGEIANAIAGRVANVFDLHGPNYVVDSACASALAAIGAAIDGLDRGWFDAAISGGIDHNMGAATYIKFCKVGALSATGTRPYDERADGFVMGEGAAVFLLKRLADAERDGDRVYAVLLAVQGSSDGRGKGITAPNPIGQKLCIARAWSAAGVGPQPGDLIEGHGTSTPVGDRTEMGSMSDVFHGLGARPGSLHLGSVKSNVGHLKGAAGAVGLLKAVLALHHKVLPPSLGFERPNPEVDWSASPLTVNTHLREWDPPSGVDPIRRAGVSAFGFAGTNMHAVLQEHVPGRHRAGEPRQFAIAATPRPKAPLRGAVVVGAETLEGVAERLTAIRDDAIAGRVPSLAAPAAGDVTAAERVAVDFSDAADLVTKATAALHAVRDGRSGVWRVLRARGVFRGSGPRPKVAFLYPGQGSQYAGMLSPLRAIEPLVDAALTEADVALEPVLGAPLSALVDGGLANTAIAHAAVIAADLALDRLLRAYGIAPDVVVGHSLGEYAAVVAAGAMTPQAALEVVSAIPNAAALDAVAPLSATDSPPRLPLASFDGGQPGHLSMAMAAILAPGDVVAPVLRSSGGDVEIASFNSHHSTVIGGETDAVERAVAAFTLTDIDCVPLPAAAAFHTPMVADAMPALRRALVRSRLRPPVLPVIANLTGRPYPTGKGALPKVLDTLTPQFAAPMSFIACVETLWEMGVRAFVEVGPKRVVHGFVEDVLFDRDASIIYTNHPKTGDVASFNAALCALYAAGLGA